MNEVLHLGYHKLSGDIMGEAMYVMIGMICTVGGPDVLGGPEFFALLGLGPAKPWQNFLLSTGDSWELEGG